MKNVSDIIFSIIPMDSLLHLLLAYLITTLVGGITLWWIGFTITQGFIFVKEYLDWKSYGHFCWKDILFGEIGALLGMILLFIA